MTLLHGCFSRFLNCPNGTKSRNASQSLSCTQHDHEFILISLNQDQRNYGPLVYAKLPFLIIWTSHLLSQIYHSALVFPFCIFSSIQLVDVLIPLVFVWIFFLFLLCSFEHQSHLLDCTVEVTRFILLITQIFICLIHYIPIFFIYLLHFINHMILSIYVLDCLYNTDNSLNNVITCCYALSSFEILLICAFMINRHLGIIHLVRTQNFGKISVSTKWMIS